MANRKQQESTYQKILALFERVDEMIKALEHPEVKNTGDQLQIAEPLIHQASESIDIIVNTYMEYVKSGKPPTSEASKTIENATRKIFIEISQFVNRAKLLKKAQ